VYHRVGHPKQKEKKFLTSELQKLPQITKAVTALVGVGVLVGQKKREGKRENYGTTDTPPFLLLLLLLLLFSCAFSITRFCCKLVATTTFDCAMTHHLGNWILFCEALRRVDPGASSSSSLCFCLSLFFCR
jgi:hypothetical protein